ncbi:hypothetical protein HA402_000077 [Bradysia odoriphaga]|nr:hypothetical protein HA402_000077 [Bradysia odoriphaga]
MENVTNMWYGPLPAGSPYVKPLRLHYVRNGVEKFWDLVEVQDSVCIIIYNKTTNKLVFVKQFRPAVYYGVIKKMGCKHDDKIDLTKYPAKLGITLELCAGTVDKNLPLNEIAREEVLEECGFNVPVERLELVMSHKSGVGSSGANMSMFYCEVTEVDKVNSGGGVDDEIIDVIELSMDEVNDMVKQGAKNVSPPACLLGILWFLHNKCPK